MVEVQGGVRVLSRRAAWGLGAPRARRVLSGRLTRYLPAVSCQVSVRAGPLAMAVPGLRVVVLDRSHATGFLSGGHA